MKVTSTAPPQFCPGLALRRGGAILALLLFGQETRSVVALIRPVIILLIGIVKKTES